MKTLHRVIPIFLVFALGFCFLSASDAQVVENDAMLIPTPGGFLSEYQLGLSQTTSFNGNFDASGLFFFGINSGANDSFFFQPVGIDEVYALFVANPGDAIGPEFVSETTPLSTNVSTEVGSIDLAVGESQYFAYYDDRQFEVFDFPESVSSDDNFGWFRLDRSAAGDLSVTSGATALGAGITVGTTTTFSIPEPSSLALLFVSALVGCTRRSRTSELGNRSGFRTGRCGLSIAN